MFNPARLSILIALALIAAGCGSSGTTRSQPTTTTVTSTSASANAGTSASGGTSGPAGASTNAGTTTPSSSGSTGSVATRTSAAPKPTKPPSPSKTKTQKAKPKLIALWYRVPKKVRYPEEIVFPFLKTCTTAGGSVSACECVVYRQELTKVPKEQSIAELIAVLELAMTHRGATWQEAVNGGLAVPIVLKQTLATCKSA